MCGCCVYDDGGRVLVVGCLPTTTSSDDQDDVDDDNVVTVYGEKVCKQPKPPRYHSEIYYEVIFRVKSVDHSLVLNSTFQSHTYSTMLTPPYRYSIVACPSHPAIRSPLLPSEINLNLNQDDQPAKQRQEILYRGSIPAARNLAFLKRLELHTLLYLRKKELPKDDIVRRWANRHGVILKWVKADKMDEEKLGMGKNEIGEVLKVCLVCGCVVPLTKSLY